MYLLFYHLWVSWNEYFMNCVWNRFRHYADVLNGYESWMNICLQKCDFSPINICALINAGNLNEKPTNSICSVYIMQVYYAFPVSLMARIIFSSVSEQSLTSAASSVQTHLKISIPITLCSDLQNIMRIAGSRATFQAKHWFQICLLNEHFRFVFIELCI